MDATRISDGKFVALKWTNRKHHPHEIEIGKFLSEESRASDPNNHCVPIIDHFEVIDNQDLTIIVMPLLQDWEYPRFLTVKETVEFCQQAFEVFYTFCY